MTDQDADEIVAKYYAAEERREELYKAARARLEQEDAAVRSVRSLVHRVDSLESALAYMLDERERYESVICAWWAAHDSLAALSADVRRCSEAIWRIKQRRTREAAK
jgi:hypothetical protein